jgi:hypothetical protein
MMQPFVAAQVAPSGSHLVTPRRGYLHHGIYVGDGNVVHYAGLAHGLQRGPVEEVTLARFSRGAPVWIESSLPTCYEPREVIRRARSRVGEDCYRLLTNNCEHFCEWCLRGTPRSYQVEAWLMGPVRTLQATQLVAQVLAAAYWLTIAADSIVLSAVSGAPRTVMLRVARNF